MTIAIVLACLTVLVFIFLIGRSFAKKRFNSEVQQLFFNSKTISPKKYNVEQLNDLPEPVKRYFRYVLTDGQLYISKVKMTHTGLFRGGKDGVWMKIAGEQYATTDVPGFIWRGTTAIFTARDMFIGDKGRLVVSLFSFLIIINGAGAKYDQGELLRWLGESVFYPTNLLPSDRLQWIAIDENTARIAFSYREHELYFIVTFSEAGEILQMETKRYMDELRLETWIIKLANYQRINGIIEPTDCEVLWRLKEQDLSYAKFHITSVGYNENADLR